MAKKPRRTKQDWIRLQNFGDGAGGQGAGVLIPGGSQQIIDVVPAQVVDNRADDITVDRIIMEFAWRSNAANERSIYIGLMRWDTTLLFPSGVALNNRTLMPYENLDYGWMWKTIIGAPTANVTYPNADSGNPTVLVKDLRVRRRLTADARILCIISNTQAVGNDLTMWHSFSSLVLS